ncbi:MAG: UDP-3-O-acyl-N-acetylglucosamine deacetylase [Proteobacteria bacterium]|nr:UDP-3-O-acyl-N-acetylglucosamine deacetylase [Pseudomonadota bacterium]
MKRIYQRTIAGFISIGGIGLHSGKKARITLRPAPENSGYIFVNVNEEFPSEIVASFDKVLDTTLATTIGEDNVCFRTIEHLISALRGMDVDNVIIEVEGDEVPIMDGSSAPFVYLLKKAGIIEQKRFRKFISVKNPVRFSEGEKYIEILPSSDFRIDFTIDFPHPLIGKQSFSFIATPESFEKEIAKARTFGFLKEVEYLKKNGFALGGSLENAVVISDRGILNKEGLRYEDEFVRHKILDLIGDIALLGYPVIGHIRAFKSGHALNNMLCRELFVNRRDFIVTELHDDVGAQPFFLDQSFLEIEKPL